MRGESLLLMKQRNEVLNHVRDAGLDPLEFSWRTAPSVWLTATDVSQLAHESGGYFTFDPANEKDWYGHFSPGETTQHESERAGEWPSLIVRLDWWLGYLRSELNEPDLWQELLSGGPAPEPEPEWDDKPFSAEERQRVLDWAVTVRAYLSASVGEELAQQAEPTITYVVDATHRLGHQDWREAARGALLGYVMTVVLPPEQAAEILRHLIGMAGRLLAGG